MLSNKEFQTLQKEAEKNPKMGAKKLLSLIEKQFVFDEKKVEESKPTPPHEDIRNPQNNCLHVINPTKVLQDELQTKEKKGRFKVATEARSQRGGRNEKK